MAAGHVIVLTSLLAMCTAQHMHRSASDGFFITHFLSPADEVERFYSQLVSKANVLILALTVT